jgi:hypothetical protein
VTEILIIDISHHSHPATFIGFTTNLQRNLSDELETGKLTPVFLRSYHALYQECSAQ